MQTLSHDAYLALRNNATVLEFDHYGEKVLRLQNGTFLKLFRRKRLLSSAAWYPYAQRFADNAKGLESRGIPCPRVLGVYRVPTIQRDVVIYEPLAGITLRQAIRAGTIEQSIKERIRHFVMNLHDQGIYFRSLHLGNIILMPQGDFGLIDIADMQIKERPLYLYQRRRNYQHLRRDPEDCAWLSAGEGDSEISS